jgi:hypothetical protein
MRIEQNLIGRTDELQIYSAAWFDSLVEEEGFEPSVPRKRGDDFSRTRSTSPPASLAVQAIRLKSLCATASHASGETGSTYGIAVFFRAKCQSAARARDPGNRAVKGSRS